MREELPFEYKDGASIPNSERQTHSWFIEAPISKDLKKSVTFRMSPMCEKEMIIVMKAPINRMASNMATFISVRLVQERELPRHIVKQLKRARLTEQFMDDLEEIEIETVQDGQFSEV